MAKKNFTYSKPGDTRNGILARKKFTAETADGGEFVVEKFKSGLFLISAYHGLDENKEPKTKLIGIKDSPEEVAGFLGLKKVII